MGTDGAADDAPLSDLAREMRERRRRHRGRERAESGEGDGPADGDAAVGGDGDGDADRDGLFESVETPDVAAESVWETLAADADVAAPPARGGGAESDPEAVGASAEGDEHVVPKRAYCQQCPHFSAPPEVACGREDTAIVEVVDADRFRVRDCPVARDTVESDTDSR